jgi:hypothetical protein
MGRYGCCLRGVYPQPVVASKWCNRLLVFSAAAHDGPGTCSPAHAGFAVPGISIEKKRKHNLQIFMFPRAPQIIAPFFNEEPCLGFSSFAYIPTHLGLWT